MQLRVQDRDALHWPAVCAGGAARQWEALGGGAAGAVAHAMPQLARPVLLNLLRRFKALVETGEIPTLARNPAGRQRTIGAA